MPWIAFLPLGFCRAAGCTPPGPMRYSDCLTHDFFSRIHWVSRPPHGQAPHRRQDDHHQRPEGDRGAGQRGSDRRASLEDRINEEVRVILEAYSDEMRKSGAQYAEMFKKVKTELAKKYKAVL